MKRFISFLLCLISIVSFFEFNANATNTEEFVPYMVDFTLTTEDGFDSNEKNTRVSGLIYSYALNLSKNGTTLHITGLTNCTTEVVKCGFKNLTIQRRKSSSDSWSDYYEYGDVYIESTGANLNTTLVVASGYQYRISCKHYAKKSLLVTQTIANTSGIVTVS